MSYIGSVPTTASFPFDQFSGTGSQTAFTLSQAPASTTSIIVAVSGVVQNPNTYGCIGTTLTFTGAPPSGTNNISILYLGLPVIGVSSPGNTAYRSVQDFTATASQTTFTPAGSYTVGFLEVYRNGARLGDADFTATSGTTVVLGTACNAGDIVTIIYFTLVSIVNAMPQTGGTFTGNIAVPTGTLYPLVSGTAVASTSGTSIDFTGIPSTAKRITVMFNGVSTSGASNYLVQLGTGGSPTTTGYIAVNVRTWATNQVNAQTSTSGFILGHDLASLTWSGTLTFTNVTGNSWVLSGLIGSVAGTAMTMQSAGNITLSGTLNMLRITTVNGTDTFDAGTINIMWE
jgi:hypothetical protein